VGTHKSWFLPQLLVNGSMQRAPSFVTLGSLSTEEPGDWPAPSEGLPFEVRGCFSGLLCANTTFWRYRRDTMGDTTAMLADPELAIGRNISDELETVSKN
jgi:hypothetical protein